MNKTGTRTLETHRLTLRQFRIGDAVTLDALRESCDAGEPERYLIPADQVPPPKPDAK